MKRKLTENERLDRMCESYDKINTIRQVMILITIASLTLIIIGVFGFIDKHIIMGIVGAAAGGVLEVVSLIISCYQVYREKSHIEELKDPDYEEDDGKCVAE